MFFFFNDTATTEIYTLSLHDALPICSPLARATFRPVISRAMPDNSSHTRRSYRFFAPLRWPPRSEEHTSELQSRIHLVCRLLLENNKFVRKMIRSSAPSLYGWKTMLR